MISDDAENAQAKTSDYKIGYCKPPKSTRFKPGISGNPKGRPKVSGARNVRRDLQQVFLQEIIVENGGSKQLMPALTVLHEKLLREALKGHLKAAALAVRLADDLGVMNIRDERRLDLSILTPEERAKVSEGMTLLRKAQTIVSQITKET
jgi:hypothetical protein